MVISCPVDIHAMITAEKVGELSVTSVVPGKALFLTQTEGPSIKQRVQCATVFRKHFWSLLVIVAYLP